MSDVPLTVNTFKTVFGTQQPPEQVVPNPILQVLMVKRIAPQPGAPERYRIVLSDSVNFIQAMLATQANPLVQSGDVVKGCIVQLNSYQANLIKEKKILIVIDLHVLRQYPVQKTIGEPLSMDEPQQQTGTAQPQPNAPQQATANSFYGAKPAQPPSRAVGNTGGRSVQQSKTDTHANTYPIEAISPYQQNWTIKARVVFKSDIKHWTNKSGEGKLFTVTFLDETGEIRATGFNAECDAFYEVLQENQVYYVSQCRVNIAKKQYSNINNDYELMFQSSTNIQPCEDSSVPQIKLNIVKLADLEQVEPGAMVDVLAVVKEVGELGSITSNATQKTHDKLEITLVDSSDAWVRCTIWGNQAKTWEVPADNVIAFKGVKVSDFGGRSLSMQFSSTMMVNPDLDDAHALKGWYDGQGTRDLSTFTSHQGLSSAGAATGRKDPLKTIDQVRDENIGSGDNQYFSLKATIVFIRTENVYYPSCNGATCKKKVTLNDDGSGWLCMMCNETWEKPHYRYIMNISVNDAFGQLWLSCFDEVGNLIMGKTADQLQELHARSELPDEDSMDAKIAYDATFKDAFCKTYLFKCRAKEDNYNDEKRMRYQVMSASPLNFAAEAAKLAEQIALYNI
ncbi:hypothetical protein EDC01DRAFT_625059 [Geopyxis carbonaria]|nr:hypothetical protein EDC01DRAFT_625059 [Geopyxis carbonaria]